ncbi:MAG: hypothetical protein H0U49_11835 [Parachlamydiaceae bacterium]|nr:hypothetical protein [Parachlamydiaceae bacterium]
MLKTIFCLSALLALGSVTGYANENHNHFQFSEAKEEIAVENLVATAQTAEEVASDVLTEITQTLAGCPNCPRNPKV